MEVCEAPRSSESDEDEAVVIAKPRQSYKLLLDSDSEEEIKNAPSIAAKPLAKDSDDSDDNETSMNETQNTSKSVDSDAESDEDEIPREEPKTKDRRKNSNPKKKVLPEKRQRVNYFHWVKTYSGLLNIFFIVEISR